jgi:cell division protein FtsQ
VDRRLAERRRRVAEDRARSDLTRLLRLLMVLGLVGGLVWFAQSPFLSVGSIDVSGADEVDVDAALVAHGVVEGRPMLVLDVDGAEAALRSDPWVAEARVARDWPTRVLVEVVEWRPEASVELADGWWLVAADGILLEETGEVAPGLPSISLPSLSSGEVEDDLELAGAVEYVSSLPDGYRVGASVGAGPEGLEATVEGFSVRLGRPFDMEEKALVTAAMIETGVEQGAIITVVAPASPAVLPPGAEPSDSTEGGDDDTTTTAP